MTESASRLVSWPDLFAPAFGFVLELQQNLVEQSAAEPPRATTIMQRAREQLRIVETRARDARLREDPVNHARFAVTALIDETVLSSRWSMREDWRQQPLTHELFREPNAGEEFYRRLENLRRVARPDPDTLGALEIYVTCISMGFRGQFADPSRAEELREILFQCAASITAGRDWNLLSPHWQHPESVVKRVSRLPMWIFAAAGLALVAMVLGVLEYFQQLEAVNTAKFVTDQARQIGQKGQ